MSRTTDAIVKLAECGSLSLTPSERAFLRSDLRGCHQDDHGRPCDCPACAPELYRDETPGRQSETAPAETPNL